MGFRDDVILRMIRQLVEAILRLRRVRREQGDEAAAEAAGDLVEALYGLPRALVSAASPDTLVSLLSPGGALDVGRAHGLGHLLVEEAALRAAAGDDDAAERARAIGAALLQAARAADAEQVAAFDEELEAAQRDDGP